MKWILFLIVSFNLFAQEDVKNAPHSFLVEGKPAVFVDFIKADYEITYNIQTQKAEVVSKIEFYQSQVGAPLFDVKNEPNLVQIDGSAVTSKLVSTPNNETQLRLAIKTLEIGPHTLIVKSSLTELVAFENGNVKSAFWTTDLNDRGYLERYMVANYEFDQVPMTFSVRYIGNLKKQRVYTNGILENINHDTQKVTFPENFTSSSIFFHTVPEGSLSEINFFYRSIDGRDLPVTIYMGTSLFGGDPVSTLDKFKVKAVQTLNELEADYGPFLHQSVTIYNAGSGGMEYCGATMTEFRALAHELTHSYFARGIMPKNGNAGWIDEALASWRDNGYQRLSSMSGSSRMANRPYYTRFTDMDAYTFGAKFMGYLDHQLADIGGLKSFLRIMVEKHSFDPYSTEDFIKFMEAFAPSRTIQADFTRYVFGTTSAGGWKMKNPMHQHLTIKELEKFL